jgi:hypothetical protein
MAFGPSDRSPSAHLISCCPAQLPGRTDISHSISPRLSLLCILHCSIRVKGFTHVSILDANTWFSWVSFEHKSTNFCPAYIIPNNLDNVSVPSLTCYSVGMTVQGLCSVAGILATKYCTYSGIYRFMMNRSRSAI